MKVRCLHLYIYFALLCFAVLAHITAVFGGCIYGGYSGDVNWLHLIDIDIKSPTAFKAAVTATATWTVVTHDVMISAPITSRAYCRYSEQHRTPNW
jgi:hypothetical protein